jgi:glycerophosphoryl diester phosphodiesterase
MVIQLRERSTAVPPSPAPSSTAARLLRIAHRGASDRAPENTLAAVRLAAREGADLIEVDLQRSRDGAVVLMHDTTLVRTTNARVVFPRRAPWRVADFTLAELRRLDAGSWKSSEFAGEQVPTLAEVIDVLRTSPSGLLLELKLPRLYPGLVTDVVSTCAAAPGFVESSVATGRLVVQSFDVAAMKDHKTQAPSIPVGLLGRFAPVNLPALSSWADQVNPCHVAADRAYVEQVQRLGMRCLVWTVDGSRAQRRVRRMGVDGIITNRLEGLAG